VCVVCIENLYRSTGYFSTLLSTVRQTTRAAEVPIPNTVGKKGFVTGHDFSRVSMGLRRTQVDENALECPLKNNDLVGVFDRAVVAPKSEGFSPCKGHFQAVHFLTATLPHGKLSNKKLTAGPKGRSF
jgi:hypothetical protein